MGEGVFEATIVRWFQEPGSWVEKDTPLLEVSTDKVDTEIVAEQSGYLIATFYSQGASIRVEQTIAQLAADKNAAVIYPEDQAESHISPTPGKRASNPNRLAPPQASPLGIYAGRIPSSPLVRKMASEWGVSPSHIPGTGQNGRITKDDLLDFIAKGTQQAPTNTVPLHEQDLCRLKTDLKPDGEFLEGVRIIREAMSPMRKKTAEHMLRSVRTSAHVTTTFEIDLHKVAEHRIKHHAATQKLTYTAYFIYAAAQALKKHPHVNASVDGTDILLKNAINIGCAVATKDGLIVPILKNTENMDLFQVSHALNDLVIRARNKKLLPTDVIGGSFSITNPGLYGSLHSQPIINQPQVAILSVGAIIERPVVIAREITIHPLCQVGLTFDHRVIDGEGGAHFLSDLKQVLENISA